MQVLFGPTARRSAEMSLKKRILRTKGSFFFVNDSQESKGGIKVPQRVSVLLTKDCLSAGAFQLRGLNLNKALLQFSLLLHSSTWLVNCLGACSG